MDCVCWSRTGRLQIISLRVKLWLQFDKLLSPTFLNYDHTWIPITFTSNLRQCLDVTKCTIEIIAVIEITYSNIFIIVINSDNGS